jgi:dynein heavy chain
VKEALINNHLYPEDEFIQKVLQLAEIMVIRHSIFIMGNPGAQKTTCWRALKNANDLRGEPTK